MSLTFDPERHEYRLDGVVIPHVTGLLAGLYSLDMVPPAVLDQARQRGVAVHKMVELWANNDLDESTLPEWIRPVFDQWLKFVAETDLKVIASERRVYHKSYRYAGTLDLRCTMRAYKGEGIIDIKRSFMAGHAIRLQTAAYAEADGGVSWRGALKLKEGDPYRFEPHEDRRDFSDFLVCLRYHQIKEQMQ